MYVVPLNVPAPLFVQFVNDFVDVCADGVLPPFPLNVTLYPDGAVGFAIAFVDP